MGIPRLTSYLAPFAVPTILHCQTVGCPTHNSQGSEERKVFVDGPALAYYIYYRLLAYKPSTLNALDAQPSYDELGQATLLYLNELQSHGLQIEKVYFDGFLPPQKRPVRISRLQASVTQLITFHSSSSSGLRAQQQTALEPIQITTQSLFDVARPVPKSLQGLPASPFLVPAVLDTLSISRYAGTVEVVDGEADSFCANAVCRSGGVIMTSDSDLLVYDLGVRGAVAFFNLVKFQKHDENQCHMLVLPLFMPRAIAKHLNIDSISRLAFELKLDPSVTLREAIQRAKQPQLKLATGSCLLYENFMGEYTVEVSHTPITDPITPLQVLEFQFMDPRISEFVLQSNSSEKSAIHVYLPFLIDDPSRLSAWNVAASLRCFAYSVLTHSTVRRLPLIYEYGRRGYRVAPSEVERLTYRQTIEYAEQMKISLIAVKARLDNLDDLDAWRCFGLIQLTSWYLESGRRLPTIDDVSGMLNRNNTKKVTWETVQLSAQFQAVMYSIRIVKHILDYLLSRTSCSPATQVVELCEALNDLPLLNKLLPSCVEMQTASKPCVDICQIYEFVINMVSPDDQTNRMEDVDGDAVARNAELDLTEDGWQEVSKWVKSKKGSKKSRNGKYSALGALANTNKHQHV